MVTRYNSSKPSTFQGQKTQHPRKERPMCTHCGLLGHTIEKCYKLHGYPPGYKFTKGKQISSANQVSECSMSQPQPQLPITSDQCQQLLALLRAKVADDISVPPAPNDNQDHLFSEMTGNPFFAFLLFKHIILKENIRFSLHNLFFN
jgi:hypothetical protein